VFLLSCNLESDIEAIEYGCVLNKIHEPKSHHENNHDGTHIVPGSGYQCEYCYGQSFESDCKNNF
jgi:hypothetical protein